MNTWRMRIRANENDVHVVFTHPNQSLIIDRSGKLLAEKNQTDSMIFYDLPVAPTRTSGRLTNRRPETFKALSKSNGSGQ